MKTKSRCKLAIFGLLLFIVPSINIVDLFPDFIAYFIVAFILTYGVDKVPYFEEAKAAFVRLGIIGLIKLPATLFMTWVRMYDQSDTDIFAMMTLIFGIIETLYLIPAISSLFDALTYLGQRSDADATIKPISFCGKKTDVTTIKEATVFFAIARAILALIPEFCLMSAEDGSGSNLVLHPYAHLYPIVFGLCFSLSLIIAIVWCIMMAKYVKAIGKEGRFYTAIDSMVTAERRPEIERKVKLKKMCLALNIIIVSTFLTFEINFDNFGNMNILPHFIFAVILVLGISRLTGRTAYTRAASLFCAIYSVVSLAAHIMLVRFLNNWSYTEIKRIDAAKKAYDPVILLSLAEFILAAALIVTVMLALRKFYLANTKIPPTDEKYGIPDRDFHAGLSRKNLVYTAFGILTVFSKFAQVLLNSGADYLHVGSIDGSVSAIVTTAIPWFGLLMTILSLLYAGSAFHFLGILKDEIKMKYQ